MWCWRMRRSEHYSVDCTKNGREISHFGCEKGVSEMKAHYLGHVVFYVKDLNPSLAFYRDLLGFQEVGSIFNGAAAALTSGRTHHELLLIQVGDAPGPPTGRHRGLYHIGIKVGDSLDELRAAKKDLEQAGVTIDGMSDHTVSQSLYIQDPDGNEVELYVDADESVWKNNPAAVVSSIKPLHL
jgi:catechol 2,3-dioxygenase